MTWGTTKSIFFFSTFRYLAAEFVSLGPFGILPLWETERPKQVINVVVRRGFHHTRRKESLISEPEVVKLQKEFGLYDFHVRAVSKRRVHKLLAAKGPFYGGLADWGTVGEECKPGELFSSLQLGLLKDRYVSGFCQSRERRHG